jgi:hypothetical protein
MKQFVAMGYSMAHTMEHWLRRLWERRGDLPGERRFPSSTG